MEDGRNCCYMVFSGHLAYTWLGIMISSKRGSFRPGTIQLVIVSLALSIHSKMFAPVRKTVTKFVIPQPVGEFMIPYQKVMAWSSFIRDGLFTLSISVFKLVVSSHWYVTLLLYLHRKGLLADHAHHK